jgi:hypothetical protein
MNHLIKVADVALNMDKLTQHLLYYLRQNNLTLAKIDGKNYMDPKDVPILQMLIARSALKQHRSLSSTQKVKKAMNHKYYLQRKGITEDKQIITEPTRHNEVIFLLDGKEKRGYVAGGNLHKKILIRHVQDGLKNLAEVLPGQILNKDTSQLEQILKKEKSRQE